MTGKGQNGFTLIELLVATTLSLLVLGVLYSVFRVQAHTVKVQESRLEAQEYSRNVLDLTVREIRNLGYFPTRTACASVPANVNGIIAANPQSIQFVYDANGDNDCSDPGENVAFAYDAANKNITRSENGGPTQALTDGNATNLAFTYFPQQTTGVIPPPFCFPDNTPAGCSGPLAANLGNIQRVSVTLTVQSDSQDVAFNGPVAVTVTSNVDLRNRGVFP